jgi:hypothetical protein
MSATKRTMSTRVGMVLAAALLALPAFAGTATAAAAVPAPSASDVCTQLSTQLTNLLGQISSLSTAANALPVGADPTGLLGQITNLQSQADAVSTQLGNLVCSSIPGGGSSGGSATESTPTSDYSTPSTYNSGHRWYPYDYYDTSAPVVSTQVVSVPRGGVSTGDGSFGE